MAWELGVELELGGWDWELDRDSQAHGLISLDEAGHPSHSARKEQNVIIHVYRQKYYKIAAIRCLIMQ